MIKIILLCMLFIAVIALGVCFGIYIYNWIKDEEFYNDYNRRKQRWEENE